MKKALITGVTGQDGAYLAELLLSKGYEVHGVKRRTSLFNTDRIDHLYQDPHEKGVRFFLHHGDMTDSSSLVRIIQQVGPDEIYNLAAQSHVGVSFEEPEYTADSDGLGALRMLEAIRILGMEKKTRFYQASTSELYGQVRETPQKETTPFYPRSPYAVAKLYAYWITVNYREAYGVYACNGILFNHESPLRGETFVTRKITRALARIKLGLQECLYLGNLDARRDWGHARDYVEMMWLMLQQDKPEDFVIATGEQHSVRDFVEAAAAHADLRVTWKGKGQDEKGYDAKGRAIVAIDPRYFRPTEVDSLLGDPSKAKEKLGWAPKIRFPELVEEMMREDLKSAERDELVKKHGFTTYDRHELKRIYVAGHRGMVGSAIVRALQHRGESGLVTRTHEELELTDQAGVRAFFEKERPDAVVMAAARVGGILANNSYPAEFIYDNLMVQANVIHEAWRAGVKNLLFLGSSCIYPRGVPQPMREDALLTGTLEPTNEPYAVAKIAGIKLCESYNRQYGTDYRSVMPTNLYGPGDNYHAENSHVIPGLIRRFHEAKAASAPSVVIWGTGEPRREFLYVDDMAEACVHVMELDRATYAANTKPMLSHINVGSGEEISIGDLARLVGKVVGYSGRIEHDETKPDGTPRKLMDVGRLRSLGWKPRVGLEEGLASAYRDFLHSQRL